MNPLFANIPTSIFEHMSGLARDHGAVNLGQGFPDFGWPEDVVEVAAETLRSGSNQYAPMRGLPALRQAVADHYSKVQRVDVTADEVTVTSGATEALASAILALVSPGDEVMLFQPLYDAYVPMIRQAGGICKFVTLTPPEWRITDEALAAAITEKTRLVIFCNPHNPTGRVFDADELRILSEHCVRADVLVISDEVWEHVLFDGRTHLPLASFPGMRQRTVKVGSAGKIFSMTGWKIGWIVAPEELALPISKAHQYLTFASAPNLQAAAAYGLGKEDAYFTEMRDAFQQARDRMTSGLADVGYVALAAQGTYFMSIDLAASGIHVSDREFCERAVREARVAAIPISAFYEESPAENVIRLCFAKQPETIARGIEGLAKARRLFDAGQ